MTALHTHPASTRSTYGAHASGHGRDRAVPLGRLTRVELRKLADTRAGLWLLIVIGLATAAIVAIILSGGTEADESLRGLFTIAVLPAQILVPVLGILSMTGEWSQRTALTTFTLVPDRGRVIAAKVIAAVLVAVAAAAAAAAFAAIGTAVAGGSWGLPLHLILQSLLHQVLLVLMGSAFGALLMNAPVAIVGFFVLPTIWQFLSGMTASIHKVASWLDIGATGHVLDSGPLDSGQWARLAASAGVWIVAPLIAGVIRVMRREVS